MDSFDFKAIPSLNKMMVLDLARCEWIERKENVIALGPSGTGKTHVALGLGLAACQKGMPVNFVTAASLVHELMEARDEKRLLRLQRQLAKVELLIIDDLGFVPLSKTGAELLLELISQRYERGSTLITSNLPFEDGQSKELARYLPNRRKKRRPHHARRPRGLVFPPDRSIHERPDYVDTRETFGEWEGDVMIFERAQGKMNVASLVERKTRFAVLLRNNDRSTTHLMNRLMGVMEPLPQPARKSITFDRGIEFRNWLKLKPGIGTDAWFCDPQAPWQKGSVENLNKRARRYLPRDAPVAALSNRDMKSICDRLNGTPRKCLGWRTPTEAFREELMKLR